ncbi:MAG TPA: NAD(P)-dependent alcohol dehydrogenase [Gemmatimonadaceae bacterium]|nr:NAD(P)-dependent alcohol dehydrogenase [Gemmatimonadaceae bacterium]
MTDAASALPKPDAGQVLVRVHASSINPIDLQLASRAIARGVPQRPSATLGFDLAGVVFSTGARVTRFAIGDRVYGRIDAKTGGAHARHALVSAEVIDHVPPTLSFAEAAALPLTAMTALQGMRLLAVRPGDHVLVNGAAGGVGVAAVQVARAMGGEVTAVARMTAAERLRQVGASAVVDRAMMDELARMGPFDAVFDATARPWDNLRPLIGPRGRFASTGISASLAIHATLGRLWSRQRAHFIVSRADGALMSSVSAMVSRGELMPVIDRVFPLERIGDAFRHLAAGGVTGKVIVTMDSGN